MNAFAPGLLVGCLGTAIVAGAFAVLARRQISARWLRIKSSLPRIRSIHRDRVARLNRRISSAQRLAEVGTLTGGLAHEIKNPLSTVQLNLQLLAEDLDPTQPMYDRLTNRLNPVRRETGRLRDILDDFLRFAGKLEIDRQPVELGRMLEDLVDFFSPQA